MPELAVEAYPLTWPHGRKRTRSRVNSNFGNRSLQRSTDCVLAEFRRMGINSNSVILSSNVELRLDGLPYSNRRAPDDPGVSVWWQSKDKRDMCIAIDQYTKVTDNMYAIAKVLEAQRGIKRWGGSNASEQAFTGFAALPSPDAPLAWRTVLGVSETGCGKSGCVWRTNDGGDFYEGEEHRCLECDADFSLPRFSTAMGTIDHQVKEQLQKHNVKE